MSYEESVELIGCYMHLVEVSEAMRIRGSRNKKLEETVDAMGALIASMLSGAAGSEGAPQEEL